MGNTNNKATLYHYTTEEGKNGILKDNVIARSTDRDQDCKLGRGVYFTSLAPFNNSKAEIARNNYGIGGPAKAREGYVDWAIEVEMPIDELTDNGAGRNIYCYRDRDLWLENYPHRVIQV